MLLGLLHSALGIVLLVGGATLLVKGSSKLADLLGVPPVLIGLTVVAWGTSVPELVVALAAAAQGSSGIVLGNVVGSNLANTGLILGLAAMLMAPRVERRLWTFDVPALLASTALFVIFLADGDIDGLEGGVLMAVFGFVTFMTVRKAFLHPRAIELPEEPKPLAKGVTVNLLIAVLGVAGLVVGGQLLVKAAIRLAEALGVSDMVIGLTLVAVGTSLPELATTLVAAVRRECGIALGNVIGSNIFNLLAVSGPAALIRPIVLGEGGVWRETGGLIAITLLLPLLLVGRERMTRAGGLALLLLYCAFITWRIVA
ncbi:calcium/sodium antiporter [bacterium]|nr:calcium/sodium antiporter [bacterium]MBU1675384.1 calcium/sodium antiporter [bacterium]